jgi:hypothetical protein
MKVTVDRPKVSMLNAMLTWIQGISESPDYEDSKDIIADFVDKVMVAEAKKASSDNSVVQEDIEIPDAIFTEPLEAKVAEVMKEYDAQWVELRKLAEKISNLIGGIVAHKDGTVPDLPAAGSGTPAPEKVPETAAVEDPAVQRRITRHRSGNGHQKTKKRPLSDTERDSLRNFFLARNGQIEDDNCVKWRTDNNDPVVGIFQVTGFISYLHREVAEGRTMVRNLASYEEWMRTKYGQLWAQYNEPRFVAVREQNRQAVAAGRKPAARVNGPITPAFTSFPRRRQSV